MPNYNLSEKFIKELLSWSLDKSVGGFRHKHHLTRFAMYKALDEKFSQMCSESSTLLSISRSMVLQDALGINNAVTTNADFPEYNILDLSAFPDDHFDFCISDQVFEHIEGNPFDAFKETVRVVKPGGYLCHTTCFINPVHGSPKDFWRYTPDALRLLAESAGCVDIQAEGWGNKDVWAMVDLGLRRLRVPDEPGHPIYELAMKRDRKWPLSVWVTARKPTLESTAPTSTASTGKQRVIKIKRPESQSNSELPAPEKT